MTPEPKVLWAPAADARVSTQLGQFMSLCEARSGRSFSDYDELWQWSVGDGLEDCWAAIWDFFEVTASRRYDKVLSNRTMPGATWFGGARLNYAEHALRHRFDRPDVPAIIATSPTRPTVEVTWAELGDQVARARVGLVALGVGKGDRVAAYLPNVPETVVGLLAASSLGAVWTSCAPEFGVQAVLDRFTQVEPKVLLAVESYEYGRHVVSRTAELDEIRSGLPTLEHTVIVPSSGERSLPNGAIAWSDLLASSAPLEFAQLAPDHPLYVLYSSGTTGLPKPIVHGQGVMVVEHLKMVGLHSDMGPNDRFFWFTTTGWMMWNYLVSGLLVGATIVLFDGDPNHAGPDTLWQMAEDERVTWFGGGAPFYSACRRAELKPGEAHDLSLLRSIGSTGAPLPAEAFAWIYESVSPDVHVSAVSGGTDVCTGFVGGSPMTPVWEGEIPCRYLGVAATAFDEDGNEVVGEQGELVITEPMPTMPIRFLADPDGARYRASYFETFPGVWRHGDWVTFTERGSSVITGRSDATLNRGGVRVGTAEIYRVAESIDGVVDSLVVHLEAPTVDDPGTLVLFVVLLDGLQLDEEIVNRIRIGMRSGLSPRHVPDEIHQIAEVPTTLSGKKLELPVKKILLGGEPSLVASRGSLKSPAALDAIVAIAQSR
jgi:acetoacetyl-CoA synthetase